MEVEVRYCLLNLNGQPASPDRYVFVEIKPGADDDLNELVQLALSQKIALPKKKFQILSMEIV